VVTLMGIPTLSALDPKFKVPANSVGFAMQCIVGFAVLSNHPQCITQQIIETGKVTNAGTMNPLSTLHWLR
jgi:putative serine protease PepD